MIKNILAEVAKVTSFTQVKTMAKEDAVKAGLFVTIGKEIDDRYMEELKKTVHPSGDHQRDGKGHQDCIHTATWNRKSPGAPCVKRNLDLKMSM